ncbi:hypothetical protein N7495_007540 [Penicillium taxi]|uniref:uncharacterized protein n=1 Tax=Penicillium taxi TaxID=168475 RepID=UPI0025454996|nr:uncharacterized protein N7495_007540 [Penicillium taxi]KAJ5887499.1 hypothetical protein N7495_007540 [Penicillium taxi]
MFQRLRVPWKQPINGVKEVGVQLQSIPPNASDTDLLSHSIKNQDGFQVPPQLRESSLAIHIGIPWRLAFGSCWNCCLCPDHHCYYHHLKKKYDGHEQPIWNHVSLNSVISWLSTIAKACALYTISQGLGQAKWIWFAKRSRPLSDLDTFDSASRGVVGSAALMWLVKGRNLAFLGGLATTLALNLVRYVSHNVVDHSQVASIASTSGYAGLGRLLSGSTYTVHPAVKTNVYSSLVDPSNTDQPWTIPQYTCPTGNCT